MSSVPRYMEVDYDDVAHRYSLKGRRYLSATQLIEHFCEKFDAEAESIRMAEDHGHTPEYWKAKWAGETSRSLIRGNNLHNEQEELLFGRGVDVIQGEPVPVQNRELYPAEIDYLQLPDGVYPELKLWRHDCRIAGRSDKIILRTVGRNSGEVSYAAYLMSVLWPHKDRALRLWRFMDIEDYKSNKALRKESFYRRCKQTGQKIHKMMLGPLAHLQDSEFNHYALQLSLYQYMGEYLGFLPGNRTVIHFPHPIEGLGELPPVKYEMPYLRKEVIAMIQHARQKGWL